VLDWCKAMNIGKIKKKKKKR